MHKAWQIPGQWRGAGARAANALSAGLIDYENEEGNIK